MGSIPFNRLAKAIRAAHGARAVSVQMIDAAGNRHVVVADETGRSYAGTKEVTADDPADANGVLRFMAGMAP